MANLKNMGGQVQSVFQGLSSTQKIFGAVILAVVAGGLLSLTLGDSKVGYRVLFSNLSQEDAAEVVTQLKEQRIPYTLAEDGRAIMVPSSQVYETRLTLAGQGLPRGGGVGFEIFDKTSFGTTDFVQRLNQQRALQGELARTIRQFHQVREARVHIATPRESVFIEDEKPPSASISVTLRGQQKLSRQQIQSVVNLVASAVPGLTVENVTLVDTAGRLLFRGQRESEGIVSGSQLELQFKLEETLRQKVETMLEEVVGVNRARARITSEMEFNRVDVTEESFDPEGQVLRSEQLLRENDQSGGQSAQGIPGVKGELASFGGGEAGGGQGGNYNRNNVTRNYEISRKTRHVREAVGTVKRLSVAVMVDGTHEKVVDEKSGETTLQYRPRTSEEMQWFEKLVKNAIGYDEERGDQVEVVNMSFAVSMSPEPEPTAIDEVLDRYSPLLERVAVPLFYTMLGLVVFLFVIRPFFKALASPPVASERGAARKGGVPHEEEEDLTLRPKNMTDRERIYRLAQSDPDRAADLVRRWLREEE